MRVTFLGTRGSAPAPGEEYLRYGGESACVMVQTDETLVLLDGGTGLLRLETYLEHIPPVVHILLSHGHLDHIQGLMLWNRLSLPGTGIYIYGQERSGYPVKEQLSRMMKEPLWPVGPEIFHKEVHYCPLEAAFRLGDMMVETFELNHPGGSTAYRLTHGGRSLVYATDTEYQVPAPRPFLDFISGCSLLIVDGQFGEEEYRSRMGWGHSSRRLGAWLSGQKGVGQVKVFHHDLHADDRTLELADEELKKSSPGCSLARQGEVIVL